MATYDILTLDELTDVLASFYQLLNPTQNVSRGSDNWKRLRATALAAGDTHAHILAQARERMADLASAAGVVEWARAYGIDRRGASAASRADAIRLTGTSGTAYTAGATLTHSSQVQVQLNASGTIPAGGSVDVDVVAVTKGAAGNLEAGQVLTFDTPISGIDNDAELQLDLQNGEDQETIGDLRARVLERIRERGKGGQASDWVTWAQTVDGIAEVYAYRHRDGQGTVDVVAFKKGEGATRFLNGTERSTLLAALDELRPHTVTVRVLETIEDAQAIKIRVFPFEGDAYAKDWDDSTPPTVSTYSAPSRLLTFTDDRPSDMRAGDRICWDAAGGELIEIESLSGTNAVVLRVDPSTAPTGSIYSGGPLTALIQTAVKNLINGYTDSDGEYHWGLGPAKGIWGGDWDDSLRMSKILAAAGSVEGALDVDVDTPAVTYTPSDYGYPNDAQTTAVTASYVFVRYDG